MLVGSWLLVTGYWLSEQRFAFGARLYWPGLTGHQSNQQIAVGATLGSPAIEKAVATMQ